jgi:fructose-1,6-bisphosphatase/inositol monophosphatase family enzyme
VGVRDEVLLEVLNETVEAIRSTLSGLDDWGLAGTQPGQYRSDLAADRAALAVLDGAGLGVLSEESGLHHEDREVIVALDPVDGSTNASRGLPWYATSLAAIDREGPKAAVVVNLATGTRFEAVRGGGATLDGQPISPSGEDQMAHAFVALSGLPRRHLGWKQFRALGAAALDLCAVASGALDAYIDCSHDAHGPWDYLGGLLVCSEAGAAVSDAHGRDLVTLGHGDRRTPVAAATRSLHDQAVAARRSLDQSDGDQR